MGVTSLTIKRFPTNQFAVEPDRLPTRLPKILNIPRLRFVLKGVTANPKSQYSLSHHLLRNNVKERKGDSVLITGFFGR